MKRLLWLCCVALLIVGLFSGCTRSEEKEGLIRFWLEESEDSECVWTYLIQPEGSLRLVQDEIVEDENGVRCHDWVFEGLKAGDASVTFQYLRDQHDSERTVTYSCFIDENLHVGLIGTVDSADLVGTADDEFLVRSVSAVAALQLERELTYPTDFVENDYAAAYLLQYVNLFYSEYAQEYDAIQTADQKQYIALEKADVELLLDIAFGNRFGVEQLVADGQNIVASKQKYYFAATDVSAIAAVSVGDAAEQLQYVFTLTGDEESVDGSAQVNTVASTKNPTGMSVAAVYVQTNT